MPEASVGAPVQVFGPTNGVVLGWTGIATSAMVGVLVATTQRTADGVSVALGAALAALVIWVVMLRPRVVVYADTLVLRNQLSDLHLPLAAIDAVTVRQTLNVWVGDSRYVCVGIGESSRRLLGRRSRGPLAALGLEQVDDRMGLIGPLRDGGVDYGTFVQQRITDLAQAARRDSPVHGPGKGPVQGPEEGPEEGPAGRRTARRQWARRELAALAVLTVALALSLVL